MRLHQFIILIAIIVCAAAIDDNVSTEEEENAAIELWSEYCPLEKSYPQDVFCDRRVGKIYYFKRHDEKSGNPREVCRTKFRFHQRADMVSIKSCAEYKLFREIVGKFIDENTKRGNLEKHEKITIFTSGYNSPVLEKNGKETRFVSKWLSSPKEATSLLENEDEKCLNIEPIDQSKQKTEPLKILTVEAVAGRKDDIVSKFVTWSYPSFPRAQDPKSKVYILCELFVPSKIIIPPTEKATDPTSPQPAPTSTTEHPAVTSSEKPRSTQQTTETQAQTDTGTSAESELKTETETDATTQPSEVDGDQVVQFLEQVQQEIDSDVSNVSAVVICQRMAENMTSESFVLDKPEHLEGVLEIAETLETRSEKEFSAIENPLSQRKNFTRQVLGIFSQVLKPKNDKVWTRLDRGEKVKNAVEMIQLTEKLGFKLACGINKPGQIMIDSDEVNLEAFSFENANISSLIFPSNVSSVYARTSHVFFPGGFDPSAYYSQLTNNCSHPAALGAIHKNLGTKLTPNKTSQRIGSEMIAFSFGSSVDSIEVDVVLTHTEKKRRGDKVACVFWDTSSLTWNSSGCWLDESSSSLHHTVCHCNHLTNFAILMDISGRQTESTAKTILSIVGLSSSTFCLISTVFFLFAVPALKSRRTTIIANICVCLLAVNFIFIFGVERTENERVCRVISGLLFYSLGSLFLWMFLQGYFLYQMIIVVFKGSGYLQVKWLYLIGYGLPLVWLSVTVSILGFDGLYHPSSYSCWISNPLYPRRIWTFVGPIIVIIFFNTIIFAKSLHVAFMSSMRKNTIGKSVGDKSQKSSLSRWFKGWLSLIFLLGLTWVFGFLYFDSSSEFFSYLFIILNSFQGVFIFLFEIVTNSKARPAVAKIISDRFTFTFTSDYLKSSKTHSTNPYSSSSTRNERSTNSTDNQKKEIPYISNRKNANSFEMS